MLLLPQDLIDKGFSIANVETTDFSDYFFIKKVCYEKYVDEYYGGWIDDVQKEMQIREFNNSSNKSNFTKILLNGETVGFYAFNEVSDKIGGITIQMTEKAQDKGMGSFYLRYITSLSHKSKKPIFLKVFKSNPAQNLYKRFGFETYEETPTHYLMSYKPTI